MLCLKPEKGNFAIVDIVEGKWGKWDKELKRFIFVCWSRSSREMKHMGKYCVSVNINMMEMASEKMIRSQIINWGDRQGKIMVKYWEHIA